MTAITPRKFSVKKLEFTQIEKIKSQWRKLNAPDEHIYTLELWESANNCSCMTVEDKNRVLAVFDIREAPAHIKNMHVIFSPDFHFQLEGQESETIEEKLTRIVCILSTIFGYVVELSNKWGTVKIHNSAEDISAIFVEFARHLQRLEPKYTVKVYRKWVEIINSSSTPSKAVKIAAPKVPTAKPNMRKGGKDAESTHGNTGKK